MFKKIIALLLIIHFISCGIANKNAAQKPQSGIIQTTKKPTLVSKKPTEKPKEQETIVSTSKTVVYTEVVKEYVEQYKDIAKSNMKNYGIPASIILAQGILESGAGKGSLALKANNHFGIKCHVGYTGESVFHDDDAPQECFRKYNDPAESYKDHSLFLTSRPRYASLFALDKGDYEAWARGLKEKGYATDPKYPEKLITYIEKYNLHQYDSEVLGVAYVPKPNPIDTSKVEASNLHEVQKQDTLYSISKKYNLTVEALKLKNNLTDNAISIGQKLIIK
jgi:flagellum-specific peptidoglycan hydrolase FlgJ